MLFNFCRDIESYKVLLFDGTDVTICKVTNNTIQSLTWSAKNYANTIRWLMVGTSTSMPVFGIPPEGFYSTGRHNDQRTFDWTILHNIKNLNGIAPPSFVTVFLFCQKH